ncbi:MAG: thiamine diphosphokinase [Hyphomicrobiales bacterium]
MTTANSSVGSRLEVSLSRFTILLGGALEPTDRLKAQVAGTRAIAADSGILHAPLLGLEVELWIGDFDSTSIEDQERFKDLPREIFPVAKDKTDGELAVEAALDRGATDLVLAGGLGGQADHALGNLMLASRLARLNLPVLVTTGLEEAYPLHPGSLTIGVPPGSRVSIVPLGPLKALSIQGVRWPLVRRDVSAGSTLTLSNEAMSGTVGVTLEAGEALFLAYPKVV